MKPYPSLPSVEAAPEELLDRGHLWIHEQVDGSMLRFRIDGAGGVRFGSRTDIFPPGDVPPAYRFATRFVEQSLDYEAATSADLDGVVFYLVATHKRTIEYDWNRIPPVLGVDVWDGKRFLPPDAVEQAFERLGLPPINTVAKEVRGTDFDPESYAVPDSNWYDGRAYGVVLRSKTGERATLRSEVTGSVEADRRERVDPRTLVDEFVTQLDRTKAPLSERGQSDTVDRFEVLFDELLRRNHGALIEGDADLSVLRARLSERLHEHAEEP